MNSTPSEPTQPPKKVTLSEFIEEKSKLVTSIAAFIALAAFSSQMQLGEISDFRVLVSALAILAAALLILELASTPLPEPRHWRLQAFAYVLGFLVIAMGLYWIAKFPSLWAMVFVAALPLVLPVVLAELFALVLAKATARVTARLFHREIGTATMWRVSRYLFVLSAVPLFIATLWLSHRLNFREFMMRVANSISTHIGQ